ncbi:integral membrane protein [Gracilibacillus halophilus YIM-C55.5]|uniref:Integral membrane protein n=1 Tax=Gracilibacillus halophilus YIM-C55.5 TaxID=1308866 RepID=N4WFW0_9BACI|nr:DUF624 domain-containing protein [Gracilibacillus halophilus]ENH98154.1 integral membrane protein [Gracilibacillus halophilus YIM-C55.5]
MTNKFTNGIQAFCEWVCYFFYLNVFWIIGTLMGGVVLGAGPSTIALFVIARKTAMGEEDIPLWQTFWHEYKRQFLRGSVMIWVLIVLAGVWYLDIRLAFMLEGWFGRFLQVSLVMIGIILVMLVLYIYPFYVHYQMSWIRYFKYAMAFGFLHLNHFLFMIVTIFFTYSFLAYLQGFIPLFGISLLVHLNMMLAYQAFKQTDDMYKKYAKAT